jgi:DNA polymerase (family 10)
VPPTLPRNAELADRFELLADMLELDGADAFRLTAYRRAAQRMQALAKIRDQIPAGLVAVMHVPGLGPKTARRLWQELGITTVDDLRAAAEAERLRAVPGLGAKTEEKVLKALAAAPGANEIPRGVLLGRALPFVRAAVAALAEHPAVDRVSEAGSVRRRVEAVKDLDAIATASDARAVLEDFTRMPFVADVLAKGDTKATVVSQDGMSFDLRVVPPESYGNLLQHFTGSKGHNVALREDAVRRRLSVSEYGVERADDGELVRMASEEDVYAFLGYAWIPPELRENRGELAAARGGDLPELVDVADIQGDLHMHTNWSDGRHTLDEMVAAALARGHRYIAICDHAKRLKDGRLEAQTEQIAALNGAGMDVLAGVEVDIRPDGTLDLADETLAARDWVMASIHAGFDQGSDRLTGRLLAAIDNPHVDCIGHPTGRKLNKRAPYDVDFERVCERAAASGTFLEVNAQADRLDLDDTHVRAAVEAGVRIVISTDAHRTWELDSLELGVAQARRGWVTAEQVVNTRPWREIKRMLKD